MPDYDAEDKVLTEIFQKLEEAGELLGSQKLDALVDRSKDMGEAFATCQIAISGAKDIVRSVRRAVRIEKNTKEKK